MIGRKEIVSAHEASQSESNLMPSIGKGIGEQEEAQPVANLILHPSREY